MVFASSTPARVGQCGCVRVWSSHAVERKRRKLPTGSRTDVTQEVLRCYKEGAGRPYVCCCRRPCNLCMRTGTPDLIKAARREGPGGAHHAELHALEYWCTTTTKGSLPGLNRYLSHVDEKLARTFASNMKKSLPCLYRRHYHQVRLQGGGVRRRRSCFQFPNPRQPQVRTKVTGLHHCGKRRATRSIMDVSRLRLQCNGTGAGLQRRNNNQSVAASAVFLWKHHKATSLAGPPRKKTPLLPVVPMPYWDRT